MRKLFVLFWLLLPLLVACGGSETAVPANTSVPTDTAVDTAAPGSDKPTLIEFYADW
ncbi:MAG: hypothetical protein R3E31_01265 [Chloroflexota bacterium]|nr:hypothetical protein [Ardenticatenaceae bacterium]